VAAESGRSSDSIERSRRRRVSRIGVELPDDRYIPVRVDDLVEAISNDRAFAAHAANFAEIGDVLERIGGGEAARFQRLIERCYAPVNPDRETLAVGIEGADALRACRDELGEMLDYLFDKANYDRLDGAQLQAAVNAANSHGLTIRVVPERIESLELYVRGRTEGTLKIRTLRRPIKGELREVDLYRRLAVVFRMRGSEEISIKLFRQIPVADVEALLPHAEVRMGSIDRLKIVGGGLGALGGVAWKAATVLLQGAVFATQFVWAVIAALGGLSVRSFFGYRRARYVRTAQMTHNLYYQNVANNAGVLDLLATSIADEEIKEVLLAYALLVSDAPGRLRSPTALSDAAEDWLHRTFGAQVDFDVDDALESLDRLDLWADRETWRVRPPADALAQLEACWRQRRTEDYHARMLAARRA
jgi:hypothetical protein